MKFKNKLTPILFGLVIATSTVLASFAPPFEGQAAAADPYGCSYNYSDAEKSEIVRSGCDNGIADASYKVNTTTPYASDSAYVLTESTSNYTSCASTITPGASASSNKLTGQVRTSAGCAKIPTNTTISIKAVPSQEEVDATTKKQAYLAYLSDQLQPIVDSRCTGLQNPTSADACIVTYSTAMRTCFDKVFPKIDGKSADADKTFLDSFSECYVNAIPNVKPKVTKSDVKDALGDNTYTGMIAAGEAALNPETSDGSLSCENSAGPFGWFLCVIISGLQSLVGGLYDNVIKPLLLTDALSTDTPTYEAWKNFRIYGDVFLIIALLIIVFGESIGGGLIDAYTAKKVLPRLLIAAILINLSFYIVGVLVDIMNVIGNGLMALITTPFGLTGDFSLNIGLGGATTMTGLLGAALVYAKVSLAGQFLPWLFFCVLLPLALIMLAIVATVLLRAALITFLVIISPVAFALYCLPNTEKYFRQWWDMLFKTLLVYPIIAALFAMGKVSGHLLSDAGGTFVTDGIGDILAVVALVIPLMLIPFSFKLAGGILGRAMDVTDGMRSRGHKFSEGTRQRISTQGNKNRIQARQKAYSSLQDQASKGGAIRRNTIGRGAKGLNKVVGGYNMEAAASAARADTSKILNDQIATGKDDEIRGLTVNKRTSAKRDADITDASGKVVGTKRQFQTLGGAWVDEADVDAGHSRWGNDTFAQQTALSYEMRKAQDEGQLQSLASNYRNVAQGPGGWGLNDQQAGGVWVGAGFERQNEHLEFKHSDWKTGQLSRVSGTQGTDAAGNVVQASGMRGAGLVEEAYQKKGSYTMAQMGANTIQQLKQAHSSADLVINGRDESGNSVNYSAAQIAQARQQQDKIKAISETFVHDMSSGGAGGVVGMAGANSAVPVTAGPGGTPGASGRMVSSPGAGAVNERAFELAVMTGTINAQPTNPNPAGSRQKTQ